MPTHDVSVVIRSLNEEAWIGTVLSAVRGQSVEPREVLVIDSGSDDSTVDIAKHYRANIAAIRPNEFSYGRALNRGFALSSGSILIALSAHAVPANQYWLRNLVRHFDDDRVAGVSSRIAAYPRRPLHNYVSNIAFYLKRSTSRNKPILFWNTSAAYRRAIWEREKLDEEMPTCEDLEWAFRIRSRGLDLVYDPESLVFHHHSESYPRFVYRSVRNNIWLARLLLRYRMSTSYPQDWT